MHAWNQGAPFFRHVGIWDFQILWGMMAVKMQCSIEYTPWIFPWRKLGAPFFRHVGILGFQILWGVMAVNMHCFIEYTPWTVPWQKSASILQKVFFKKRECCKKLSMCYWKFAFMDLSSTETRLKGTCTVSHLLRHHLYKLFCKETLDVELWNTVKKGEFQLIILGENFQLSYSGTVTYVPSQSEIIYSQIKRLKNQKR